MARPINPDAKRNPVSTRLSDHEREWLTLWRRGGNASEQLSDLIERAMRFWPAGPDAAPPPPVPGVVRQSPAIVRRAAKRGLTKAEYLNLCSAAYEADNAIDG